MKLVKLLGWLFVFVSISSVSYARVMRLKVMFYKVQSLNHGLNFVACRAYFHDIEFSSTGNNRYRFSKKANPRFYDHKTLASLLVGQGLILQQVTLNSEFNYEGKSYNLMNTASSLMQVKPFLIHGVIGNKDCKAAYVVVDNDMRSLGKIIHAKVAI